jgi:hypothetical protein
VLEKVLEILEPMFESPATPSNVEVPKPRRPKNVFELLEVEDCVEDDLLQIAGLVLSQHRPSRSNRTRDQNQKESPSSESKWLFRAYCAFQDFDDIRRHVRWLWEGYRDGNVDLITASMVTDIAFCLMEDIDRTIQWSAGVEGGRENDFREKSIS